MAHFPAAGLIDLHTHIVPGVDDGAQTPDEALAMARVALADGIAQVVATPHIPMAGLDREECERRLGDLRRYLAGHQTDVEVHLGAEVSLEPDILRWLAEGLAWPIASTRYILVELPFFVLPPYTDDTIFRLQVAGYKPILAHPERNASLAAAPERLGPLVERGVLVQITTTSILGGFGAQAKSAATAFLQRGWVHVLASDAHSANHRPPSLTEAAREAERVIGPQAWSLVTTNPAAILGDSDEVAPAHPVKKARR
ncbi:MAG: hypothetical protein H5T65_04820 [Chloroflexi bacterium]|nr:hypothetical protein [Chloroflexota bacterium]